MSMGGKILFTSTLGYLLLILSLLAGIYVLYLNLAGIRKRESLLASSIGDGYHCFLVTAASLVLLLPWSPIFSIKCIMNTLPKICL